MTQQEIQQRNESIAIMLGSEKKNDGQFDYWTYDHLKYDSMKILGSRWCSGNFEFHSDWNWLHEAVEFIEKQKMEVSIIQNECSIIDTEKAEQEENPFMIEPISKCFDAETKKEAVFIAVSDFAQKFNNKEI
jgi:hypothetical protein